MATGSQTGASGLCVKYCGRSFGDLDQYKACLADCFGPETAGFYEASETIWQTQAQYYNDMLTCAQKHSQEAARIVNERFVRPVNEKAVPLFYNGDIDDRIIDWKISAAKRDTFQALMIAAGNLGRDDPFCLERGARELYVSANDKIFLNLEEEMRFNRAVYPHDILNSVLSSHDNTGIDVPIGLTVFGGIGAGVGFVVSKIASSVKCGGIIGAGVLVGMFAVASALVSPARLLLGPRSINEVASDDVLMGETSWHRAKYPPSQ